MSSCGEMTFVDFQLAINWLCDISQQYGDQWLLNHTTNATPVQEVYASKRTFKKLFLLKRDASLSAHEDCPDDNDIPVQCDDVEDDAACLHQSSSLCESAGNETLCQLDHHILYSHSYSVPVLYFNVYKYGGQLLTLPELWNAVSDVVKLDTTSTDMWKVITQQEHPLLRRPYFHLHPCHTAELMTQLRCHSSSPVKYLLIWLSTVAPAALLDLPLCYAAELTDSDSSHTLSYMCSI